VFAPQMQQFSELSSDTRNVIERCRRLRNDRKNLTWVNRRLIVYCSHHSAYAKRYFLGICYADFGFFSARKSFVHLNRLSVQLNETLVHFNGTFVVVHAAFAQVRARLVELHATFVQLDATFMQFNGTCAGNPKPCVGITILFAVILCR
jgi:hypothetical protein